jgi:hypothetical protein
MIDRYGGEGTRWDVLKKALLDPERGLIKANERDFRFGLVTYTGLAKAPSCPALEKVRIALGNFAAIDAAYGPATPPKDNGSQDKGETPTGESIAAVTAELDAFAEDGPKHIVLATDGEPDTCPGTCTSGNCSPADRPGWPRDPNCGHDRSIAAVQAAFGKGIKTYVIGIGNDVGAEHLQALANAGAGFPVVLGQQGNWLESSCNLPPSSWKGKYVKTAGGADMTAKFWKPNDAAGLAADLRAILGGVRSCKYTLNGTVNLRQAPSGRVSIDGKPLTYDDPNGWRMSTETELELLGAACTALQSSDKLEVGFPCGVFIEIK